MRRLISLWRDDAGAVLSAEAALLGTVGVLGGIVGVNLFTTSVNDELRDVAYSFRSLDQSYSVSGHRIPTAWTAGSGYTQEPVAESLEKLRVAEDELRERYGVEEEAEREADRHDAEEREQVRKADGQRERERDRDDRRRRPRESNDE